MLRAMTADAARAFDHVDTWVFDLDNTLYPHDANVWEQVDNRITTWIAHHFGVDGLSAKALQKHYYQLLRHVAAGPDDRRGHRPPTLSSTSSTTSITRCWHPIPRLGLALVGIARPQADLHLRLAQARRQHHRAARHRRAFRGRLRHRRGRLRARSRRARPMSASSRGTGSSPTRAAMFEDLSRNLDRAAGARHAHRAGGAAGLDDDHPRGLGARRSAGAPCPACHRRSGGISHRPASGRPPLPPAP